MTTVSVIYPAHNFPDSAIYAAAGRSSDGCGTMLMTGERDHEWHCKSQLEAERIKRGLKKIGLIATVSGDAKSR